MKERIPNYRFHNYFSQTTGTAKKQLELEENFSKTNIFWGNFWTYGQNITFVLVISLHFLLKQHHICL